MKASRNLLYLVPCVLLTLLISGCGSSSDSVFTPAANNTYSTTSSKGDYSEWTIVGNQLDATLNVVSDIGDIEYTFTLDAACGAASSFGVRTCTIASSSCADGTLVCPAAPTGSFEMMDVPGVALFIDIGTGPSAQLHIGFAKDSTACGQDVSGDYTMIHTGLGLEENFGMYQSDSDFVNIIHSDFGFFATSATATPTVAYRTGGTGTGVEALIEVGCADGVRVRTASGSTIRSMMTTSGLFVLDLPSGQGGLIAFKTSAAATLADFENKSFGGISFPDEGDVAPLTAMFGVAAGGKVDMTATIGVTTSTMRIMALSETDAETLPAYPNFSVTPAGYSSSALFSTYGAPTDIPGLFKLDGLSDTGRVIIAAMKFNSKVVGVGMVYNWRTTTDTNPADGNPFSADGLYNTGNFLIFEK